MNTDEINVYRRCRKTIFEMLEDRGYTINKPKNLNETNEELYSKRDFIDSIINASDDEENEINVMFFFDKMGIAPIKDILEHVAEKEMDHVIIVSREKYTSHATSHIKYTSKTEKIHIEPFLMESLLYNITHHSLQPNSVELIKNKEEIKKIYKTFGMDKNSCRNIKVSNPFNKYYDGRVGQIYRVINKGGRLEYVSVV